MIPTKLKTSKATVMFSSLHYISILLLVLNDRDTNQCYSALALNKSLISWIGRRLIGE